MSDSVNKEQEDNGSEILNRVKQADIITGSCTSEGLKRFTEAVLKEQLKEFLPIRLNGAEHYKGYNEPSDLKKIWGRGSSV